MKNTIKGVGCDIVSISRLSKHLTNDRFFSKIFTEYEKNYCLSRTAQTSAGIWAAKEAVSKALGTGFCGFVPRDIEVRHNDCGQPTILLYRGAKALADQLEISAVHISISHDGDQALAFAVAE